MPWKTIMFVTIAIATLDGSCLSWYCCCWHSIINSLVLFVALLMLLFITIAAASIFATVLRLPWTVLARGVSAVLEIKGADGSSAKADLVLDGKSKSKVKLTNSVDPKRRTRGSLKKLIQDKVAKRKANAVADPEYGRYSLRRRFNKDQVPQVSMSLVMVCTTLVISCCSCYC